MSDVIRFVTTDVSLDPQVGFIGFADQAGERYFWMQAGEKTTARDEIWLERDDQLWGGSGGVWNVVLSRDRFIVSTRQLPWMECEAIEIAFAVDDETYAKLKELLQQVMVSCLADLEMRARDLVNESFKDSGRGMESAAVTTGLEACSPSGACGPEFATLTWRQAFEARALAGTNEAVGKVKSEILGLLEIPTHQRPDHLCWKRPSLLEEYGRQRALRTQTPCVGGRSMKSESRRGKDQSRSAF